MDVKGRSLHFFGLREYLMSYAMDYYPSVVAQAPADARATFIRKTYGHLAGAVLAFIGVEALLLQIPGVGQASLAMLSGRFTWFIVLLAFMGVSWLATSWAQSDTSRGLQYLGLGLYVVAQAVLFLPILYIAANMFPGAIQTAGGLTFFIFLGLTVAVLTTKRDFSHLGSYLSIGGMLALGFIVVSMFFATDFMFTVFCFFMVALASGYIIYHTSQIMYHYRTDQYVAASLALFASVMLLFWYILQIVMRSRD
jgi:FtsH-binding integral membrane protein